MNKLYFALFISAIFIMGFTAAKEQSMKNLRIKIEKVSLSGVINVEIVNASKDPIKVWQESNSWGAARWRVLRIRKGQIETFFQNPNERFTRNIPTFIEIAGGAHTKHMLNLNGGNWCGLGHCSSHEEHGMGGIEVTFEPNDIIVVTYDVPRTNEAVNMGVWYGVTAAIMTVPQGG